MGTWNAFYVKGDASPAFIDAIRASFGDVQIDISDSHMGVRFPDTAFDPPVDALSSLSDTLSCDVHWLGFQSTVDALRYHHWSGGAELRCLVYGMEDERVWEQASGTPEPWEESTFFNPNDLKQGLKWASSDEERDELQSIWRDQTIAPGATLPSLASDMVAHAIARHYGFPHF